MFKKRTHKSLYEEFLQAFWKVNCAVDGVGYDDILLTREVLIVEETPCIGERLRGALCKLNGDHDDVEFAAPLSSSDIQKIDLLTDESSDHYPIYSVKTRNSVYRVVVAKP